MIFYSNAFGNAYLRICLQHTPVCNLLFLLKGSWRLPSIIHHLVSAFQNRAVSDANASGSKKVHRSQRIHILYKSCRMYIRYTSTPASQECNIAPRCNLFRSQGPMPDTSWPTCSMLDAAEVVACWSPTIACCRWAVPLVGSQQMSRGYKFIALGELWLPCHPFEDFFSHLTMPYPAVPCFISHTYQYFSHLTSGCDIC